MLPISILLLEIINIDSKHKNFKEIVYYRFYHNRFEEFLIIMARSHERSSRKYTGKKYKSFHKKRKRSLARHSIETQIGQEKKKKQRTLGGNYKLKLFSSTFINVTDLSTNKTSKVKILKFESNAASKDLNRRHILTKGAIVETELGKARISSRPGQHGILNGVLLSD
jgi:small subunit ribosomal protein S8e